MILMYLEVCKFRPSLVTFANPTAYFNNLGRVKKKKLKMAKYERLVQDMNPFAKYKDNVKNERNSDMKVHVLNV